MQVVAVGHGYIIEVGERAHSGVSMEGYFWRISDPATGRVVIALCGANTGPRGRWATVGVAAWPSGFISTCALEGSWTDADRLGIAGGVAVAGGAGEECFDGTEHYLRVQIDPDAHIDLRFEDQSLWPKRLFGGSSVFHMVPGLNQYWHPWLLGGRATGRVELGGETWDVEGADVYGEKNWGKEGFPESWWWGEASSFAEREACVAFAGGRVTARGVNTTVTALVVRLPDGRVIRLGNPVVSPVRTTTTDDTWHLEGRGFGWHVTVYGVAPLNQAFVLPVPLPSEHRNVPGDLEHLVGNMYVVVRRWGQTVWCGHTSLAALEHGGLDRAEHELMRRGHDPNATHAPPWPAGD